MSELETGTAEAASPAEAVVESQPAAPTPEAPAEVDRDAELLAIYNKHNPQRGPDGKFQSRNPVEPSEGAPETTVEGQPPSEATAEPAAPAIPAPNSWPAEMKAKWDTLPPDAREYIAKRESEAHQTISRMGQQVSAQKPVADLLEQNRAIFERNGMDYQTGIKTLLNAQVALETNPVHAIQQLAQAYGVDLGLFSNGAQPAENGGQITLLQRQIADLQRQLQDTSTRVQTREQQEQLSQQQALEAQVNDFLKDKPDFAKLEDDVLAILPAIKAKNPGASPKEALALAYEQAQWLNPETRAAKLEADRKAAEAKAAEEARKRASEAKNAGRANVKTTAPVSGKAPSWEDEMMGIYRRNHGNA